MANITFWLTETENDDIFCLKSNIKIVAEIFLFSNLKYMYAYMGVCVYVNRCNTAGNGCFRSYLRIHEVDV